MKGVTANPVMPVPRDRWVLYCLVILSTAAFAERDGSYTLLAFAAAASLLAWVVTDLFPEAATWSFRGRAAQAEGRGPAGRMLAKIQGVPISAWVVNAAVLAAALQFCGQIISGESSNPSEQNLVLTITRFVIVLMLCKLFERRTPRDNLHIMILTLLIIVSCGMFSSSLTFAWILAAYLALLGYGMMLRHVRREFDRAGGAGVPMKTAQSLELRRQIRRVGWTSAALLAPISVAIFLTLPRTRGAILAPWSSSGPVLQTGFSENLELPEYGTLNQSDAVVMYVTLQQNGVNIGSDYDQRYFRGTVLDAYDNSSGAKGNSSGAKWVHSEHGALPVTPATEPKSKLPAHQMDVVLPTDLKDPGGTVVQHYWLQSAERFESRTLLFSLAPAVHVIELVGKQDSAPDFYYSRKDMELYVSGMPIEYMVTSPETYTHCISPWDEAQVTPGYLGPVSEHGSMTRSWQAKVPEPVMKLARQLAKLSDSEPALPLDRFHDTARLFMNYLRSNYSYSLQIWQVNRDLDPTEDFLLNRKATGGPCTFFASAFVMMCRSVGMNAHVVTGFYGGEYNSVDQKYVIRQKDAHAWAEVCMPDVGWERFDPTPAGSIAEARQDWLARWLYESVEIAQRVWQAAVVSFDNESRRAVMNWISRRVEWIEEFLREGGWTVVGPVAGLMLVALWLLRRWRRDWKSGLFHWRRLREEYSLPPETAYLQDLLAMLPGTGGNRRFDLTPRERVEGVGPGLGPTYGDALWLVDTFYGLRFGLTHSTPELKSQITQAMRRVRRWLRTGHSR